MKPTRSGSGGIDECSMSPASEPSFESPDKSWITRPRASKVSEVVCPSKKYFLNHAFQFSGAGRLSCSAYVDIVFECRVKKLHNNSQKGTSNNVNGSQKGHRNFAEEG
mmetsp:Transcript_3905/g.7615  ORF Transcript_3905/g.7615 Transcript_3905/m.7615 type:complete len:108 (+) Transcript_3905:1210-1533(+)